MGTTVLASSGNSLLDSLQTETDGMLLDFTKASQDTYEAYALIRDTTTPANAFDGDANSKLTYTSPSAKNVTGSDGTLKYANHNEQLYSTDFTQRTKNNVSTTADTVTSTTSVNGANIRVFRSTSCISGIPQYRQIELKYVAASGATYALLNDDNGTSTYVDLVNETIVSSTANDATIETLADGWLRVSYWWTPSATNASANHFVYLTNRTFATASPALGVGDSIQVRNEMIAKFPVHSPEHITTTTAAKYRLPIDHDSAGNPLGLLVEEARTNLCLQSETLDNASWSLGGAVTITANATTAPDGTTTAEFVKEDGTNAYHNKGQSITITAAAYTWSIYAKANGRNWLYVNAYDGSSHETYFDLQNGVVGTNPAGNTSSIQNVGNGWYRCIITRTSGGTSGRFTYGLAQSDGTAGPYTGDNASGIYVWGAQLEAGSFPTSYIKTTSATVTRAKDDIVYAGAYAVDPTVAGTLVYAFRFPAVGSGVAVSNYAGNTAQYISMQAGASSHLIYRASGATQCDLDGGTVSAVNTNHKIAGRWATNNFGVSVNGGAAVTDVSGSLTAVAAASIKFGKDGSGNISQNQHVRYMKYTPRTVSDADLATESA